MFSNEEEIYAGDVVNAIQRNMKDEFYGAYLDSIKNISEIDDKTILIDLKYPFGDLLEKRLAMIRIFPDYLTDAELKKSPYGSGP